MRLQKLTIHNIASIEDAVIDFEAQPLVDSEVFLITGKTGAGKSTILDAICLALFADTPRLSDTKMQGDTEDGTKSIKIDDPCQLMRRNTGEAFASLSFIDSNNVHYEAIWSVARARKKVTGNIQNKDWQLKNLDAGYTLTKDKEIKAEIHAAIGLDFNQFCRTTLLAQGEFTRFLNSKDDDKAEILEKITGVDVYSKIGEKIFEVTGRKKKIWDDAQRLVEGTRTLTDAEIAEKQKALSNLDDQYKVINAVKDKDVAKRDWLTKESELTKDKNDAAEALRIAKETTDSEDFKQKEQTVKDWNATIDARKWLTDMNKASNAQNEQQKVLEDLSGTYSKLLGGQKFAENEVGQIEAEIKKIEAFVSAESDRASTYENAQTIVSHLTAIDEGRKAVKKNQSDIESETRILTDKLIPVFEEAQKKEQNAKIALKNKEEEVKAQEEAVATLNLPELRHKLGDAKDLLGKITTAKERIDTYESAKIQYNETRSRLAERKAALENDLKESAEMDTPIREAQTKMNVRKEDLDMQSNTVNKFASTLRTKLHVGDTCPVCRQEIKSAFPHEEELATLVSNLEQAYKKLEVEYNNLKNKQIGLNAKIETESNAYDRDIKKFNEDKSVADAEQKAMDACKACGIEKIDETTLSVLAALEVSTTETFNELDAKIKDGDMLESKVTCLRNELGEKRKKVESSSSDVHIAENDMNKCKSGISIAQALVETKNRDIIDAEQKASELIVGKWQIDWKESPMEFATALTTLAQEYISKIQKKQTLASELKISKDNVENVQIVLNNILSAIPLWKDLEPFDVAKVENLLSQVNNFNTSVATALNKLKAANDSLKDNQKELDAFLKEHPELNTEHLEALNAYTSSVILGIDKSLATERMAVVAKQTLFDKAENQIKEHQKKKPELAEDDTLNALIERISGSENQLAVIGEKKGAINQELKTDRENRESLGMLIEDADKKQKDYQKWSRMNQLIGDATGNKFRKIAQSYVLTSLIHSANSYMKTLTDRYTLKVTPGTFVITLEDAYQGFVSRAASTISGGESFLVSLSLALALSDIGQTLSVDTLFIDEGFGTLSGEPLQNAINTLRSLHTKAGRHVGIISHVEELQERIPIQIQVIQEGNNSCSKVKVVPEDYTQSM